MTMQTIETALNGHTAPKALRKLKKREVYIPGSDDPTTELKSLVRQHRAHTETAVAIEHQASDRKNRETGEVIPCRLADDVRAEMMAVVKSLRKKAASLESAMTKNLKKVPVYEQFLQHVFGVGPIVAAYIVAEVDIYKATKPSNLKRFCGLAVINGRLERPTKGQKLSYSTAMRTRLFQMCQSIWKNRTKTSPARGFGTTSKYIKIWSDYLHRIEHSNRVFDRGVDAKGGWTGKLVNGQGKTVSARGFAFSTGWHKAADIFVDDLYTVWRALEGLPVWPDYYAAKLGYEHGGKICVKEPRMLSVREALDLVGEVGPMPAMPGTYSKVDKAEAAMIDEDAEVD